MQSAEILLGLVIGYKNWIHFMKRLLMTWVLLAMVFPLQAQDRDQDQDRDRDQLRLREYLLLEEGTLLLIKDQDRTRVRDQIKLNDGTIVSLDGTYKNTLSEQYRLRERECLDFDGNKYLNQQQFRDQLKFREQASKQLHYLFQDGKVYRVQDQERNQVRERIRLHENATLNPDGKYQLKNQNQMRLRDGECLDPEGNHFINQAELRNHEQLRLQAMMQEHYLYKDGNMYQVRNQQQNQLREQRSLQNGMFIHPDGKLQLNEREMLQLRDGECIDPEGNLYGSQNQYRNEEQIRLKAMNQEHYLFEDGQMYVVQNQWREQLRQQETTQQGTIVNPDGTFQNRNQEHLHLSNGECLDPEGNRYQNKEQYQHQVQNRYMALAEPHFIFRNGKVYQNQNQVNVLLNERWILKNGTIVNPDGTYQLQNGNTQKMRNGEFLDWEGNRYENREMFRERMEKQIHDRKEYQQRQMMERKSGKPRG